MLDEFIAANREEIIMRCRARVGARVLPPPTSAEIDEGVPQFLDQVASALRTGRTSNVEIDDSAARHGDSLLRQGFTVSQVVHDYGDICQSITELAIDKGAPVSTENFRTLNLCLDDAIAAAVTQYARAEHQALADSTTEGENRRINFLSHELRNLVHTAILAFGVLQRGDVGVAGSTGTVLHRSLTRLRALIDRSLAEVRLTQGIQNRERFLVSGFLEDLTTAADLEARARGVTLAAQPVEEGVAIEADRQVLMAAVANLLQNALKFTRPLTTVTIRVRASAGRVLIEVEDECGGLPGHHDGDELFRPFVQQGVDRSGLGLGLPFCQWAVEANDGRLSARSLTGQGCIFTVDLPQAMAPALVDA